MTPDQIEGAEFLAARTCAMLTDKAGFGKTAQFVRACDLIGANRVTVICPPVLRPNEAAEFAKWGLFGLPVTIIRSGKDAVPPNGVVVVSYNLVATSQRIQRALTKRGADALVFDEAHALKDPRSKRARAIFGAKGIASTARHVWFVTATPTPNHAGEFYTFARASGAWNGTYNQFIERYCQCVQTPFGVRIQGAQNEDELKAMLRPFVLGRDKIDPERGPITIDEIMVEGTLPKFDLPTETMEAIEAAIEAGDWRALDGPAVATVRRHIGTAKAPAVADLARCALEGGVRQMLIFCEFRNTIDIIADKLGDLAAIIDGRTTDRRKESLLTSFQHTGTPRVLVCQRMALKEGVTLTAATRVLLAEPPWTPNDREQMIARAWRRGQKEHVYASSLYLADSFDSRVAVTLIRKEKDIARINMSEIR